MPIKIRQIRSSRKAGEKLTFATLPTREAKSINSQTLKRKFNQYYGTNADYNFLAEQVKDFSVHDSRERVIPVVKSETKKRAFDRYFPLDRYTGHYLALKRVGKKGKTIALVPAPVVHDIWLGSAPKGEEKMFGILLNILDKGFRSSGWEGENAYVKGGKNMRFTGWNERSFSKRKDITYGDSYGLELFPNEGKSDHGYKKNWEDEYMEPWNGEKIGEGKEEVRFDYELHKASPKRILSVNIKLNPESSNKEKLAKMRFYKEEVADKYNVPVRFYETLGKLTEDKGSGRGAIISLGKRIFPKTLEGKVGGITAIIGIIGGLIFLSSNLTGNAIGSLNQTSSNVLGAVLFLIGIAGAFLYFKRR